MGYCRWLHHLSCRWQNKCWKMFSAQKVEGRGNISWQRENGLLSQELLRCTGLSVLLEISIMKIRCLLIFLFFVLPPYWCGTREKFMHRPSSPSWGLIKDTRSYCFMIKAQSASRRPLIGVYHFVWGAWCVGLGRGGLDGIGISSSGIITTAFFAFSSLAPSSVDPLSPHRTSILLIPPTPLPP